MTLTRRAVLGGIATTAAMAAGRWEPAQARPPRHSANGWPLIARPPASRVEGADLSITLAPGPAAAVLLHFLRRFLYEVDHAVPQSELVSHLPRPAGPARYETNHLSGTAIAIRPTWYPSGVAGGFDRSDIIRIRDILADCEGLVRWGADADPVKESHFQIDVPPADPRLPLLAQRLERRTPGLLIDPAAPQRRLAARNLALRQQIR